MDERALRGRAPPSKPHGSAKPRFTVPRTKGAGAAYVYARLQAEILSLSLPPGADLDEAGLVQRFGLSRTPVREALIRLAADGLVMLLPNRGAKVAPVDLIDLPRYVEALDLVQRAATRFAALRRTAADLSVIVSARDAFEQALDNGEPLTLTEKNRDFHVAIGDAAHNAHIAAMYRRLLDQGMRLLRIPFAYESEGDYSRHRHLERIKKEHRAITKAIKEKRADQAETLAHGHTELFRSRLLQYLEQNLAPDISLQTMEESAGS